MTSRVTRWLIDFLRQEGFVECLYMPTMTSGRSFTLIYTGLCDGLYVGVYEIPGDGRDFSMLQYYAEIRDTVCINEQHYVNGRLDVSMTGVTGLTSLDHSLRSVQHKRARLFWRNDQLPSYVGGACRD
ncbi:MAG: hypothetical protein EOP83_03955 [Verrucomicrobiaceae bacterium]|nr:MAG: hypothetical protein EOP83_03955 [Verrucomicrobiaceae bacterium]